MGPKKAKLVLPEMWAWSAYPHAAGRQDIWPRGLPPTAQGSTLASTVSPPHPDIPLFENGSRVAVIQSLIEGYPDTEKCLPDDNFPGPTFKESLALAPCFALMTYNAMATLHLPPGFLGLLLPVTVTEGVSDIWRSFFTQRILCEAGIGVAVSPPWVTVVGREEKKCQPSLSEAEDELRSKSDTLVYYLVKEWHPPASSRFHAGTSGLVVH